MPWVGEWVGSYWMPRSAFSAPGALLLFVTLLPTLTAGDGRTDNGDGQVDGCQWLTCTHGPRIAFPHWGNTFSQLAMAVQDNFPGHWEEAYINGTSSHMVSAET
jgi:hypothetical protein